MLDEFTYATFAFTFLLAKVGSQTLSTFIFDVAGRGKKDAEPEWL